jgi:hypothetical protein
MTSGRPLVLGPTRSAVVEWLRLHRRVKGLIDADRLLAEEGGALRETIEAAR